MARVIFWISFAFVFYVYFGYPLLMALWRWMARKPVRKASWEPVVSMVIAAHNERENIGAKISNCLDLDYPRNKLEVLISLDGPTDGTERIAREYEVPGITIIHSPVRQGKATALNRGVAAARGEVIVFADARQRIDPRAIRELVANLCDNSVGAVSGELILLDGKTEGSEDAHHPIGLYWRYEKWLRAMESDIHSAVGATGAIYAIRRELFRPVPDGTILDDVMIPMRIVLMGKRLVFEPGARAYDRVACCPEAEFSRKVRTLAGNYQIVTQLPELALPWRNPIFLQFVSHKAGRLLVPYFLTALFLVNSFMLRGFYLISFALQVAFYLLAFSGRIAVGSQRPEQVTKPFVFGRS